MPPSPLRAGLDSVNVARQLLNTDPPVLVQITLLEQVVDEFGTNLLWSDLRQKNGFKISLGKFTIERAVVKDISLYEEQYFVFDWSKEPGAIAVSPGDLVHQVANLSLQLFNTCSQSRWDGRSRRRKGYCSPWSDERGFPRPGVERNCSQRVVRRFVCRLQQLLLYSSSSR